MNSIVDFGAKLWLKHDFVFKIITTMGEGDFNSSCPSKRNQSMLLSYKALEWVPVSSTGKIFCR